MQKLRDQKHILSSCHSWLYSSVSSVQPHDQRAWGRAYSSLCPSTLPPLPLLKLELLGKAGALAPVSPGPASPCLESMSAYEPSQATLELLQGQTWRLARREGAPVKDTSVGSGDPGMQAHTCKCLQGSQVFQGFEKNWKSGFLREMS